VANPKKSQPTWLIDLDNTLHNAGHAIFPAMHDKMNAYMADLLGSAGQPADAATVDATRLHYWKKYGATLLGLMEHHNVKPAQFLHYAHQFDDLAGMIRFESGLRRLLQRLPGRKILLTNAPRDYAQQVLGHMGLRRHFDRHISIESMHIHGRLRPKPSRWLLKKLSRKLARTQCIAVEDSRDNLRAAKQMGMKTVWITQYLGGQSQPAKRFARASFIDIKIRSIKQLPAQLSRLSITRD